MKRLLKVLAVVACLVLSGAAVWLGGLNQDEGWYLYAAQLVSEGKMLYRDFFFTQGPVLPLVYAHGASLWHHWGLLGGRLLTLAFGLLGLLVATALARRLAPEEHKSEAAWISFVLLGCNLYHLYFLAIPKTYALAALFVLMGFYLASFGKPTYWIGSGLALAFAAGTRISLGALLAVVGLILLVRREWKGAFAFAFGGLVGLVLVYGPYLFDPASRAGLMAAQAYHAARGGFDLTWTAGSLSRLVRWYAPIFLLLAVGGFRKGWPLAVGFAAVFLIQIMAPFPYEDYQVPIMALLAVYAAVNIRGSGRFWPVLFLVCACSFGSPLLEKWMTNGQDRFWSLKKAQPELAQLQKVAETIEALDPGGKKLLTQDLYLAIECNRKVPRGLEMGPFSMLTDAEWRHLLETTECPIAALSGYTFAVEPPSCKERDMDQQMAYWKLLTNRYELVMREENFGQNATPLLILKRK